MRILIVFALAVAAVNAATLVRCTRSGTPSTTRLYGEGFPWADENATKHYAHPDLCTTWDHPYCIPMNQHAQSFNPIDEATWEYGCAECRSTCDCRIGYYCQTAYSEDANYGRCVSYSAKLGTPCDANLDTSGTRAKNLWYGQTMMCAIRVNFRDYQENYTAIVSPWAGTCVNGRCRECNSYVIPKPGHDNIYGIWFTGSAQEDAQARTLRCLWSGARTMTSPAPYKRGPYTCRGHEWSYTNGVSVAAPAAVLLAAIAYAL